MHVNSHDAHIQFVTTIFCLYHIDLARKILRLLNITTSLFYAKFSLMKFLFLFLLSEQTKGLVIKLDFHQINAKFEPNIFASFDFCLKYFN